VTTNARSTCPTTCRPATPAQWQAQLDLLSDLKLITAKPKVEDVLDTSFLDKVLKDGKVIWPG